MDMYRLLNQKHVPCVRRDFETRGTNVSLDVPDPALPLIILECMTLSSQCNYERGFFFFGCLVSKSGSLHTTVVLFS